MLKSSKKKIVVLICMLLFCAFQFNCFAADNKTKSTKAEEQKSENLQFEFIKNLQNILNTGDLNAAILSFDSMPEKIQDDVDLLLIKASLLISATRVDEAVLLLDQLEKKSPSNIEILEMKIVALKAKGKNPKNVQAKKDAIAKVLAKDPNNAVANIELGQENVLSKKYKIARNYFKKALKSAPNDLSANFGLGQTCYYIGDIEESKEAFKKILEINPNEAIAYQYLGKLEAEDENYKRATEYCQKAILLDGQNYDFYMDLGTYSRFCGKFADAEKAWTKAISLNPTEFLAYAYRAGLYDEQNKFDLALQDYRKVVETNPKYYFAYEALGILAWHEQNWEEARKAFEIAYSYNKENVSYPLMIASCYHKLKKTQQAKTFLQQVMKTKAEKNTLEFQMIRLFHDLGPGNAETEIALKIQKEDKSNVRGKMLYYFGLYYEIKNITNLSKKYYSEVTNMQSPMFFEYRLAEWGLQ